MPLANPLDMLRRAAQGGYAIGAFTINNMELAQAVADAAAATCSPAILQLSANGLRYARPAYLKRIAEAAAEDSGVPLAIHLDHGESVAMCRECVELGFGSVMYDGSALPFEENIRNTREVAAHAHAHGAMVEAELGRVGGKEDDVDVSEADACFTDPERCREFVERTECDSLAIAIGTCHGPVKFTGEPRLDFDRLSRIRDLLPGFPLVLHGASSLPEELLERCRRAGVALPEARGVPSKLLRLAAEKGIAKVNTDTDLRLAFSAALREYLREHPDHYDPRQCLGAARSLVTSVVRRRMEEALGCAGRA